MMFLRIFGPKDGGEIDYWVTITQMNSAALTMMNI